MSGAGSSTSAEGGNSAPAPSWGGNLGAIVTFLQGKGLSNYAIAGIVGNLKTESGLSTTAYNAGEGAIGLAQWEGGRRTALQSWAAAHGGQETDLNMQLGYLWHELTTSYSGVLTQLRTVKSATDAATIWDAHYEVSAGTTRQERISAANAYLSSGFEAIGGEAVGSSGGSSGGGATAFAGMTASDYTGVDGLGKLLNSIPELSGLVDQAISGNWTVSKFQNAVEDSHWYKTHSDTARSIIAQQSNDPASYAQNLTKAEETVRKMASQLGMPLSASRLTSIASYAMLTGNSGNQQWLTDQLFTGADWSKTTDIGQLNGQMAQVTTQLQQMASSYGYQWTAPQMAKYAQSILDGATTIDTYKSNLIQWAKSAFPSLAKSIDQGSTVADLATPYVQSMSQLLEVDPGSLNLFTPSIRKALQGYTDPGTKERVSTPLWQFEDQVRQDPRWAVTQNAKDTVSSALVQLGSTFGFGPQG